jgi:hypothetical protein
VWTVMERVSISVWTVMDRGVIKCVDCNGEGSQKFFEPRWRGESLSV